MKSIFVLIEMLIIWRIQDYFCINAYKRCKKQCDVEKCNKWMCKKYHKQNE